MDNYKVIIAANAERDLSDILSYISDTLFEPSSAKRICQTIKAQILSLSEMPQRFGLVAEEPYESMGVRKVSVENYIIFYLVNEKKKEVLVLRVLYNRREWHNLI